MRRLPALVRRGLPSLSPTLPLVSFRAAATSSASAKPSAPVRTIQAVAHFTGSYLDVPWTRQFIVGSLLQRYDPLRPSLLGSTAATLANTTPSSSSSSSSSSSTARAVEAALLESQRVFSSLWNIPVRPLDKLSETRILRLLARYAAGEGVLSDAALDTIQRVLSRLPGAPASVADPVQMRALLELLGYVEPGDNLHRVAYAGELEYPPQAHAFMAEHLEEVRQVDGGDAFDCLREWRDGPGYAIDSATTSEVDDAIGVCTDPATQQRYFVVYVSDATVYCPFDSALEQVTARRLTTTTYLPEGVFFMLPKPIVEAATLREDRPCRTFNIVFQIDEATGDVKNYAVAVGWLKQLRRITYDQVQELIDNTERHQREEKKGREGGGANSPGPSASKAAAPHHHHPPPAWLTGSDEENLLYILRCARIRLQARLARQRASLTEQQQQQQQEGTSSGSTPPMDFSLPDPLIKVKGTRVLSVTDQVIATQDARLAVAELMIAANEVCSRVAQANRLPMPFRGTRALSSDHEVAQHYAEPQGVSTLSSLDASHVFLAEAMQSSVRRLSTVTRAIYHHLPLHHAGLDTSFYTHSTSPLRRYADMLVHHQLKTWLWQQQQQKHHSADSSSLPLSSSSSTGYVRGAPQQFIPEHAMATLCAMISTKQERASLLQDSSTRFWILRYLDDLETAARAAGERRRYLCLVGETRRVCAAPAYSRFASSAADISRLLSQPVAGATAAPARPASPLALAQARWLQPAAEFTYVSDVYLPEVQLAHIMTHDRADVRVGAVVECEIACVQPTQGVLEMRLVRVLPEGDERHYERLWMGAIVSQLDA